MIQNRFLLTLFGCLFGAVHLYAQPELPHGTLMDFTVPEPNAASLGKFGDVPVNYSNGLPRITIPIYSYADKTNGLALDISLDYHAAGIRVQEKACNVGIGWALNAGGVITRQMRGGPDEGGMGYTGYWSGPALPNITDYQNNENLYGTTTSTANPYYRYSEGFEDSEPDVFTFNFNGRTGKFIFGKNNEVFVFPQQRIAVSKTVGGSISFTITTEDGVKYIFDQQENSSTYKDQLQYYSGSAWYLSKIIEPFNTAEISFSYESYTSTYQQLFSQTMFKSMGGSDAELNGISSYVNYIGFQAKRLTAITFPQGVSVTFSYAAIERCDISGDKALTKITVSDGSNSKSFRLAQNYSFSTSEPLPANCSGLTQESARLVLHSVTEYSGTTEKKPYIVEYNSGTMPSVMSYAVDHWGFYNGATANSSLLPYNGLGIGTPPAGAMDNANRNPSFTYAQIGTIKKIIYPTGGESQFTFESNDIPAPSGQTTNTSRHAYINGMLPEKSVAFTLVKPGTAATATSFTMEFGGFSAVNSNCRITVKITSLDGLTIYGWNTLGAGTGYLKTMSINIPSGQYKYSYEFESPSSPCTSELFVVALDWIDITPIPTGTPVQVGGLRIKKIEEFDGIKTTPINVRQYSYIDESAQSSSGALKIKPEYVYYYGSICTGPSSGTGCDPQDAMVCNSRTAEYTVITGSSLFTLSNALGNTVLYSRIEEKFTGDGSGNNGRVVRTYTTGDTYPTNGFPFDAFNPAFMRIPFVTPQSLEWIYGALLSETTFDNANQLKHKKVNTYSHSAITLASNVRNHFKGIKAFKRSVVVSGCDGTATSSIHFQLNEYFPVTGLTQLTSTEETSYGLNGVNNVATTFFEYDNAYYSLKRARTVDSKGRLIEENYYYPFNYTADVTLSEMVNSKHIYTPLISKEVWQQSVTDPSTRKLINGQITEYAKFNNLVIRPSKSFVLQSKVPVAESSIGVFNPAQLVRNSTYYKQIASFDSYTSAGYLLQQKRTVENIPNAYIWDTKKVMPIAQVTNAKANEIFFDGFEEVDGWDSGLSAYDNAKAHTGRYAGRIDGQTSVSAVTAHSDKWTYVSLSAPATFKYSGWVYSDGPAAELYVIMRKAGETNYYTYYDIVTTNVTGKWVYLEKTFTVPQDVVQLLLRVDNENAGTTGKVWVDDLRLHPSNARMTTVTYQPLVGITSQSTENNTATLYEYDALQRLYLVRDKDRNILKRFCYNYFGQPEDCLPASTPIWRATGRTRCQPCPANSSYTSGLQEHEEEDINSNSTSGGTFRWVLDGASSSCVPSPDWQNTGAVYCKTVNGVNTGERAQMQTDVNPCSNLGTREIIVDQNCTACPKPANWQIVSGSNRCQKDANNQNTGYEEVQEINVEPCSPNFNATRWVKSDYKPEKCPNCNATNCSGNDKKCINGVCETGVLKVVAVKPRLGGGFTCTWKYCFSDGSLSTYSTSTISATSCPILPCP